MKTRIKHYSRSAISVLLSLCMLVSCMTVGLIATDAAVASADEAVGDPSSSLYFHLWGAGLTDTDTTLAVKGTFYDVYETGSNEVTVGFSLKDGNKEYRNGEGFAEGESVGDGRTDKWMNTNESYDFHNVKLDANSVYQVRWTQYDSGNDKIQIDIRKKPPTVTLSVGNAPTGNSGAVTSTACVTVDGAAYDAPTTSVTVNKGKTATVTVIPSDDTYKATTFTVNNGSGKDLTYDRMSGTYIGSFDLTENATVTFQGLQQKSSYKVNVVSADNTEGTVSAVVNGAPLDPEASYLEGTAIELTGVPNGDFVFSRWAFKKTADDESRKTTYYLDAKDVTSGTATITGYFSVDGYQISVDGGSWVDMNMLDDKRTENCLMRVLRIICSTAIGRREKYLLGKPHRI